MLCVQLLLALQLTLVRLDGRLVPHRPAIALAPQCALERQGGTLFSRSDGALPERRAGSVVAAAAEHTVRVCRRSAPPRAGHCCRHRHRHRGPLADELLFQQQRLLACQLHDIMLVQKEKLGQDVTAASSGASV